MKKAQFEAKAAGKLKLLDGRDVIGLITRLSTLCSRVLAP